MEEARILPTQLLQAKRCFMNRNVTLPRRNRSASTPSSELEAHTGRKLQVASQRLGAALSAALLLLCPVTRALAAVRYANVNSTNATPPYTNWATAATVIQDAVDLAEAGDEIVVTNGVYATGGRAVVGTMTNRVAVDRPLTLRSVNGPEVTVIQGHLVAGTTNGAGGFRCVYLADGASLSGFTLTNGAGGVWCSSTNATVANCVIAGNVGFDAGGGAHGGTLIDCTLVGNSAVYSGAGACGSILNNCTLTSNTVWEAYCCLCGEEDCSGGAAAYASTLNNCTLAGNLAVYGGGAAHNCTLVRCILTNNYGGAAYESELANCSLAKNSGRGAFRSTLQSCTVTGNSGVGVARSRLNNCLVADNAGGGALGVMGLPWRKDLNYVPCFLTNCTVVGNAWGTYLAVMNNCIVYFNGQTNFNSIYDSLDHCCVTPLPEGGVGNITNAPLFVDYAGGNLRLRANSPCINAGYNACASGATDLDGLPRIVSGTVDIGAYEFQGPGSIISYAWLQQYGLPTDGSADFTDPDADEHTIWQEWRCQTNPTNEHSALRILSVTPADARVKVSWQSVVGVSYSVERSTNLAAFPAFSTVATNLLGQETTTAYSDTNIASSMPLLYRVRVEN